ncbi:hypothetical protein [Francisella sp. TX07-6608]|uniref:hypothetical protein n=1 Tax=Francisella sp. TX07-6608 TaxID=573568 RepID=UPI0008F9D344|nr:hypothetical protein [Francisella sp. TX07-6608]OIN84277.1 hypothetical protein KX00_707 [Francisella sp. TX07-6608]
MFRFVIIALLIIVFPVITIPCLFIYWAYNKYYKKPVKKNIGNQDISFTVEYINTSSIYDQQVNRIIGIIADSIKIIINTKNRDTLLSRLELSKDKLKDFRQILENGSNQDINKYLSIYENLAAQIRAIENNLANVDLSKKKSSKAFLENL